MSELLTHKPEPRGRRSKPTSRSIDDARACRIALIGRVQGLGVRPAIARLAHELQVAGSVSNSHNGVSIYVEGAPSGVKMFCQRLVSALPVGAVIEAHRTKTCAPIGLTEFCIERSSADGALAARVPPDVAACRDCLAEVTAPQNHRYRYPFTTCTRCGPRYSIIDAMPYDRASSGMATFAQCPRCRDEYARPADRRFHSQTNCCSVCGPRVWLSDASGGTIDQGHHAVETAGRALRSGRIVALRGLGGYQLVVDATSDAAVRELRRRKRRHGKPLAVMVAGASAVETLATSSEAERIALGSPANPIVVLNRQQHTNLASSVHDEFDTIGVMLPTTPLHEQIAREAGRPLVVTSGNPEGDPLVFEVDAAMRDLSGIADVWLHHDRPIVRPIDDTVVRVIAGREATLRLGRGLAPLPLNLETRRQIVALGGHQKTAVALSNGAQAVLGPHLGDLNTDATRTRYVDHVSAMRRLYGVETELLVHDEHPDYFTTTWAARQPVATMAVQHHHAHVVAGMLEHDLLGRTVLGISWDGTGYGPDGTVWGGEFLVATADAHRRVAHLRRFSLPGGEAAVREPWRVAVALVHDALGARAATLHGFDDVAMERIALVEHLVRTPRLCPQTSSAGRLFDGIAALVLGTTAARFEGQPAMLLEAACDASIEGEYDLPYDRGAPGTLDWRPLVRSVLADRAAGVLPGVISMRFHRALAGGIANVVTHFPELPIVLGGGCFNNRVLTELVAQRLTSTGRLVATPGTIPTGDGGLAAGQLAIAAARLAGEERPCV